MTTSKHRLEQAIEAAHEYRRCDVSGDMARLAQIERTIDDLVGYWDEVNGPALKWPRVVLRVAHGGSAMTPTADLTRLTLAIVLAMTAPEGREADADTLVQRLAYAMPQDDIDEAQRQALAIMDGVTA